MVKIDTPKYFAYLVELIKGRGGMISLGVELGPEDVAACATQG